MLNEYKSIAGNVERYSEFISDLIYKDILNNIHRGYHLSPISSRLFLKGRKEVSSIGLLDEECVLTIDYTVYVFDSINEYNQYIKNNDMGNSECDWENKHIYFCLSIYKNGDKFPDFDATIQHEIQHIYQYSKGMTKNVDLYNKVTTIINGKEYDISKKLIATVLYFTFRHEQDAFANQFYAFLKQNNFSGRFEDALKHSMLNNFSKYVNKLKGIDSTQLKNVLNNEFGLTLNSFNKRVEYSRKRLKKKLKNVYDRIYLHEDSFLTFHPEALVRNLMLEEINKENIKSTNKIIDESLEYHYAFFEDKTNSLTI